jgi:hypothetical protein
MRILRWILGGIIALIVIVGGLDTFGGYLFDGPLGPIPGGRLSGAVNPDPHPDWSNLDEVMELEIRPAKPWSLSVWNIVVDGELYVPSASGARRRWTAVVLDDPMVRVRAHGQIFERRIEQVTDPGLRTRIRSALAQRYGGFEPEKAEEDTTWYFHLGPRG